jgi:hypothetical protein
MCFQINADLKRRNLIERRSDLGFAMFRSISPMIRIAIGSSSAREAAPNRKRSIPQTADMLQMISSRCLQLPSNSPGVTDERQKHWTIRNSNAPPEEQKHRNVHESI